MDGDAEAFAEIYQIFINTIYYNVSKTLTDRGETEDAVQQVVISLHKGLPKLKSPYAFHAYLYRITMNVCNKYNMKEAKQRLGNMDDLEGDIVDESAQGPPQELERKERDELIRVFIEKLPEKQRYTLLLYYYHDMPYKDIAKALDTTVTVVGSNINRAKKNMKRMLEEHEQAVMGVRDSEASFQGVSLDALLLAGVVTSVDNALEPGMANMLWQRCVEQAPEIIFSTSGTTAAKASAAKAIVAGTLAAGALIAGGVIAVNYVGTIVDHKDGTPIETQRTVFIPETVIINFTTATPDAPGTYNPIHGTIELSEGFPVDWRITDVNSTVIAQGVSLTIEQDIFDPLATGEYQVEWTISNEEGDTGIAYRPFTIQR
ncbi:MAG: sigma-70 family RNA polymerase sigma factor [Coriobacteriia bacterium]|nr:sigma-70 family RNA polymerase sigma factor [Coriobacteriia bacterium]